MTELDTTAVPAVPAAATSPNRKYVVAHIDDIAEGGRVIVTIQGKEIGVYRVDGSFYAMLNRCPHLGGPLCEGQVVMEITATVPGAVKGHPEKTYVTCPWHNWEFDIKTGQSYWNPKGLRSRPVPIAVEHGDAVEKAISEGNAERVKGPFAADMLPVNVEDNYVVLTVRNTGADGAAHAQPVSRVLTGEAVYGATAGCASHQKETQQ